MSTTTPRSVDVLAISTDRVVDNQVYVDPAVYRAETDRIFDRVWQFACHESEIREVGDFLTLELYGNPVLLTRDHAGKVRAFYNTCRHRGATVVMEPCGHASSFRCPYHFWVYSLEGDLAGVTGPQAYDGTGFRKEDYPLVSIRCESVLGLVFVNFDVDAMPLTEWLGEPVIAALSKPLANAEFEVFNQKTIPTEANWKVFAENARDGYHVPFVHPFFRRASPPGPYRLYPNGHAVQALGMDAKGVEPDLWVELQKHPFPGVDVGEGYIVNLFPDLAITLRSNVISIDMQLHDTPESVTMFGRQLGLVGDDEDVRAIRRLSWETWFNNPVELEDHPIFEGQQRGVRARGVPYSIIARGADALEGVRGDDNRLRHFWVQWRAMMGVSRNSLEG